MTDPTLFDAFDTVTPHPVTAVVTETLTCSGCGGELLATGFTGPHEFKWIHDGQPPRYCASSAPEPRLPTLLSNAPGKEDRA